MGETGWGIWLTCSNSFVLSTLLPQPQLRRRNDGACLLLYRSAGKRKETRSTCGSPSCQQLAIPVYGSSVTAKIKLGAPAYGKLVPNPPLVELKVSAVVPVIVVLGSCPIKNKYVPV